MAALDKAGHFRRNNNDSKNEKGTVNIAAAADKDDESDESNNSHTKTEDSATSTLTQDMTLGKCFKLTGVINTTVGMSRTDGEIYEEEGS